MKKTSLYIHTPWCVKKCPYCDFNSHTYQNNELPEAIYLESLLNDLIRDIDNFGSRPISSIFIGGGTPSLLSGEFYHKILENIGKIISLDDNIEITIEANPGTVDTNYFNQYVQAGINRISIGVQSFNNFHLKKLGRIHDANNAMNTFALARKAGFENINIDIMHSLPQQSESQALEDLSQAIKLDPEHISWYQLTIEPNTMFYKTPPELPNQDNVANLENLGTSLLIANNYLQYEISAFSKKNKECQHNLNYWMYGDYYGIGAGAHGKLTLSNGDIIRTEKKRIPRDYMNIKDDNHKQRLLKKEDLIFEFMLNTTRLRTEIPFQLFSDTTNLAIQELMPKLKEAEKFGFIKIAVDSWELT